MVKQKMAPAQKLIGLTYFCAAGFCSVLTPRFMLRVRRFAAVREKVQSNHQCKHPPLRSLLMLDGAACQKIPPSSRGSLGLYF